VFEAIQQQVVDVLANDARLSDGLRQAVARVWYGRVRQAPAWAAVGVELRTVAPQAAVAGGTPAYHRLSFDVEGQVVVMEAPGESDREAHRLADNIRTVLTDHLVEPGFWFGAEIGAARFGRMRDGELFRATARVMVTVLVR